MNRLLVVLALFGVAGCSAQQKIVVRDGSYDTGSGAMDGNQSPQDTGNGTSENEGDFLALKPSQTDVYVFVANPDRDTVTRVNVFTKEVRTAAVGSNPTAVLTTPDYATCVVFDQGDDAVTILDAPSLVAFDVKVRDNFNNMVMSPDGKWVALWHDVAAEKPTDPKPTGLESYDEVSLVNVATGAHFPMAVGFDPRSIQFTPDGRLGVVVSDSYLAKIDLTATTPTPHLVQISDDLINPPVAEEVEIAPSGTYAFVRQFGTTNLVIVGLEDDSVDEVEVGANPTDLDLTPDGKTAVVVARDAKQLWLFSTNNPYDVPTVLGLPPDVSLGQVLVDPTGTTGILYTTASAVDRYATWDLATGAITLRSLVKPVSTMAVTPDGASLLVFHTLADAPGADTSSPFYGHYALTMVSLADFRSNPLKLPAEPIGYSNSDSGRYGYFIMDKQDFLEALDYDTLLYEQIPLKSDPVYVGVMPDLDTADGKEPPAWVSQEHSLGRISFYNPDDGSFQTITGFELNSEVGD